MKAIHLLLNKKNAKSSKENTMSFLSKLSLANRSIVALATIAVILFGLFVIPSLKQDLIPPLTYPAFSILTAYPGASSIQVEQDVTNPLEQTIQGVQGLQQFTSQSNEGLSVITVIYSFGTDLDKAQQTLSTQVNRAQPNLPTNVTPQLQPFVANFPILSLSVTSSQDQQALALGLKQIVVPALQRISGVSDVNVTGVRKQIVTVTLDLKKLQSEGLSVVQVQNVLQANNLTLPVGEVTSNDKTFAVRVGNTFNSIGDLKNIVIGIRSNQTAQTSIKLSDVAVVQEDLAPSSSLTRISGKPSLGIAILKTPDGNTVSISQAIRAQLPELEKKLGYDAKFTITQDDAPSIQSSLSDLTREGVLGALFSVLVILVFLFSVRSTLVIAIAIPLSVIVALIGLWTQNYSLNILTLSGLTIAIGRVVDDSIVVLENIYRHLCEGEEKRTAVLGGVKEVAAAVTASTLTTVAVFLPLAFIGGITGIYIHPLALTVTIALLASLLVALTVIPVLAYWFLKIPKRVMAQDGLHEKHTLLERGYIPMIEWVMRHRAITLLLAVVLLIGSFALIPTLPINTFGYQSQNDFSFQQTLPPNTSVNKVNQAAQQVEAVLARNSNIQMYQVTIGGGGSTFSTLGGTNTASFAVTTYANADGAVVQQSVRNQLNKRADIGIFTFTGQATNTVDVTVQAVNEQILCQTTQQVLNDVIHTANTSDVTSDLADTVPLINVHVNQEKALKHGLTTLQVSQFLQMAYSGTRITHVVFNSVQQDVNMKIDASAVTIEQMQDILLPGLMGNVRLGDVADISQISGPTQISHSNAIRTATISLTVTNSNIGAVESDVQNRINRLLLPNGATAQLGSAAYGQDQVLHDLYIALLVAIPLVFLIMVATFRSLIQPLLLLVAIPFAACGSLVLAATTRTAIGVSSLFGFLMLIGIVVTNAIVLIDLVNQYRTKGMDARSAVIEGGRRRVRPILMTAVATIMALLPMALGVGGAGNGVISGSLAIVVIGGLTSSTVLTLLLVPTLYVIVEDIKEHFAKKPEVLPATQEPVVI